MKKVIHNKVIRDIFIAFLINVVWLFLLTKMFTPSEKTDDMIMKFFLSGAFSGEVSPYVQYSNILLGQVLAFMQRMVPAIPWYEMGQYCVMFASFVTATYIILREKERQQAALILVPFLFFWEYDAYIKMTFTKTAGVGSAIGFFAMCYALKLKSKSEKIWITIIGFLLVILGSVYRYKEIKAVFAVIMLVLIMEIIVNLWMDRKNLKKNLLSKKMLVALTPVFVVALTYAGATGIQKGGLAMMRMHPEWNTYKDFNTYKVPLQDYGWPDYVQNYDAYTELGISYNDFMLWSKHRDYGEPTVLTTELLKSVYELKNEPTNFSEQIQSYIDSLPAFLEKYPVSFLYVKYMLPALIFIILFLATDRKGKWFYIIGIFLMLMLLMFYLFEGGRYGRDHVDYGIWLTVSMSFIYLLLRSTLRKDKLWSIGLVFVGILIFQTYKYKSYINTNTYTGNAFSVSHEFAQADIDFLTADQSNLYVLSSSEYTGLLGSYNTAFSSPAPKSLGNIYVLSGYMYPPFKEMLERYGINNIYEDLCTKSGVYYVSRNVGAAETVLTYIREHYNANANCYQAVHMVAEYYIYKFYIDDDISDDDFIKLNAIANGTYVEDEEPAEGTEAVGTGEL